MHGFFNRLHRFWLRRRSGPTIRAVADAGWSFEATAGSGLVTVVIRDKAGKLQYQQTLNTDRLRAITAAANGTAKVADEFTPAILRMPEPIRPSLSLLRAE